MKRYLQRAKPPLATCVLQRRAVTVVDSNRSSYFCHLMHNIALLRATNDRSLYKTADRNKLSSREACSGVLVGSTTSWCPTRHWACLHSSRPPKLPRKRWYPNRVEASSSGLLNGYLRPLVRWLVKISRSGASGKPQCFPASSSLSVRCHIAITDRLQRRLLHVAGRHHCHSSRACRLLAARPTDVQPPAAVAYRLVQS